MRPDDAPFEVQQIMRELMNYWRQNPEAKDTLGGIEHCWLKHDNDFASHSLIQRAVQILLHLKWVSESSVGDGVLLYSVSPTGLAEAAVYLDRVRKRESKHPLGQEDR
jgi:hypothetical protein